MDKRIIILIGGAVVCLMIAIGAGMFVLMPTITAAFGGQPAATTTPTVSPVASTAATHKITPAQYLSQHKTDIKNQIAQGLKLTPDQLTQQLQGGKTLTEIATAQGVSNADLQTLVGNTITTVLQPSVANGDLTQQQLTNQAKRFQKNPDLLDRLLGGKANNKKQATPGAAQATPTPAR